MEAPEARKLLTLMRASFPQREMTTAEVAVWCDTMAPVSFEAGRVAVLTLKNHQDWPPTHHQFLEAARSYEAHQAAARVAAAAEMDEPVVDDEVALANVREMRSQLARLAVKQRVPRGETA